MTREKPVRWAKFATATAAVVVLAAVVGSAAPERPAELRAVEAPAPSSAPSTSVESRPSSTSVPPTTAAPPSTTTTQTTPTTATQPVSSTAGTAEFMVRSITDGDTLVLSDGRRLRLAQVDAPETNECFGSESTKALSALAAGKTVTLRRPPTGPATDRYGRTLADVYVGGASVNEALVRNGDAEWYESFAHEDANLAERLRNAENEAKEARRGLWSACAAPAAATASSATEPSTTTAKPAAASGSNCDPAYPDDCIPPPPPDLNCAHIGRKVRVDHRYGDPHGFDRDKDGWGCESYG